MSDDRRATLEAAMNATEEGLDFEATVEKLSAETVTEKQAEISDQKDVKTESSRLPDEAEATDKPKTESRDEQPVVEAEAKEKPVEVDRAPQSWKPAQKAKWASLDPDIRQEVIRRENETTRVLNETTSARQFSQQFQQALQPYMARVQQVGNPLVAVQNLLAADHLLATGPKAQKAQYLAKLIKDYGVDIQELDAALAGSPVADPVASRVEQLLQERLTPFQQYISQQQQREQQAAEQSQYQISTTVEQMAKDPAYPYFEDVRNTMADLIELKAKRGQPIDLPTAYNMAIAMDPDISQVVAQTSAAQTQAKQAAQANTRAQRALKASASVGGAPNGSIGGKLDATDRRAMIEAAFEAGGR